MFRSIQNRVARRVEVLKRKTLEQSLLEKAVRKFFIQEFGPIGETLGFSASKDRKRLRIWIENKTASNEVVLRSSKLAEILKENSIGVDAISIE